jgi:hypothetical protein
MPLCSIKPDKLTGSGAFNKEKGLLLSQQGFFFVADCYEICYLILVGDISKLLDLLIMMRPANRSRF